jgi:hypothetical protein
MRTFTTTNPETPTVQEYKWDILRGMRSFATTMGVVRWNITYSSPSSNSRKIEWSAKGGEGKNKGRRSGLTVEVVSTGVTTGMTTSPFYMKHRKGKKGRGKGEWKETVMSLCEELDDPGEDVVSSSGTNPWLGRCMLTP